MNHPAIIILFALLLGATVLWIIRSGRKNRTASIPSPAGGPSERDIAVPESQNDKLILVDDIAEADLERILEGFCALYNKGGVRARPRLFKAGTSVACITFPYDIDFELLCFLVNYISYPAGFDRSFNVTAWATTRLTDAWITEETAGKKVMLSIPDEDSEYDNVLMTTPDNMGYKLSFAARKPKPLPGPGQPFRTPPMDAATLMSYPYTDFS